MNVPLRFIGNYLKFSYGSSPIIPPSDTLRTNK
jgi:hypothetical protein